MAVETAEVKAKFDGKEFVLTDRSANLREPPGAEIPLLNYLNILGANGWSAAGGRFDGWSVILDLEKQSGESGEKKSSYMMALLHQVSTPGESLAIEASDHAKLFQGLQEVREREGWVVLVGPKHLSSHRGFWTVAIWMKH